MFVGLVLERFQTLITSWLTKEKQGDHDGSVFDQPFVDLLWTLLITHTEEEKDDKVLGYDVDQKLDMVNKPTELKLDDQRNTQTMLLLLDVQPNDKSNSGNKKRESVFYFVQ